MATAPECIARFEREAIFPTSPERMGRALRQRAPGTWPSSPIGGGGASPHVALKHLANFMICQAGFVPSEAAVGLPMWRDLPVSAHGFFGDEDRIRKLYSGQPVPAPTLGGMVEAAIDAATDPTIREALTEWTLIISPDEPCWARILGVYPDPNPSGPLRDFPAFSNASEVIEFGPFGVRGDRVRRTIEIPRPALMISAELWADSKAKLAAKDENAVAPGRAAAASTAPTARQRQVPSSSDASVRVRAPATTGEPRHARRRRNSLISTVGGAA